MTREQADEAVAMNPQGACFRLSVDFPSASALMSWFESIRSTGGWGTVPEPGFELPEGVPPELDFSPQRPRTDVGVRVMDALDQKRASTANHFLVSSTRDGGLFLDVAETTTTEPTLKPLSRAHK